MVNFAIHYCLILCKVMLLCILPIKMIHFRLVLILCCRQLLPVFLTSISFTRKSTHSKKLIQLHNFLIREPSPLPSPLPNQATILHIKTLINFWDSVLSVTQCNFWD
ncbi:hypothetical protein QVD17_30016 [Tagetes erecta]|uniref:Uncharacterized protein n=1 Tax=Tagetes erecta TaxID=13708 RepID=A0AAD8NMN2_TARER|nr:hypothetical protein QVD17_30016 [Tagetes erecta]